MDMIIKKLMILYIVAQNVEKLKKCLTPSQAHDIINISKEKRIIKKEMKDKFDITDRLMIFAMLNGYIAECIQEQAPQCVIDEMVKSKEKLTNLLDSVED